MDFDPCQFLFSGIQCLSPEFMVGTKKSVDFDPFCQFLFSGIQCLSPEFMIGGNSKSKF